MNIEYGIQYGQNVNETLFGGATTENLYMNIYQPTEDNFQERPAGFGSLQFGWHLCYYETTFFTVAFQ